MVSCYSQAASNNRVMILQQTKVDFPFKFPFDKLLVTLQNHTRATVQVCIVSYKTQNIHIRKASSATSSAILNVKNNNYTMG